jgi:hypothetical protein
MMVLSETDRKFIKAQLFGLTINPDRYCPTWGYHPLKGWRKMLARVLPNKWFKRDRYRVYYKIGDILVCSFENYAYILKEFP